ncbi:hypothetical protein Ddc_01578 [Ditylenchus destructor]|nr:hypothetical protein Ddc_01578 [Ditylenchus destructor]
MDNESSTTTAVTTPQASETTTISVLQQYWNNITENILPPVCWCTVVILISFLLICYRRFPYLLRIKRGGLSVPMLFFLVNHLVNSCVFLFSQYIINNIVTINPNVMNANNWLNTWWSFWVECLDPGTENNPIGNRPCLPIINQIVNFTYEVIKVLFATLNLTITLMFLYMLYRAKVANINDGIVRFTAFCEFIFDVVPAFLMLIFSAAHIMVNLNVYTKLMASADAALCAIEYTRLMFNFKALTQKPAETAMGGSSRATITVTRTINSNRAASIN